MIGRRQIREKVLQAIYANNLNHIPLKSVEKNLFSTILGIYELYVFQINLLVELKEFAIGKIESNKKKNFQSDSDKNPNLKFSKNIVLSLLEKNMERKTFSEKHKELSWKQYDQYTSSIFKKIIASERYEYYMRNEENTFEEDLEFVMKIFDKFISNNESIHELYEDISLSWADDLHIANSMTYKTLKFLETNQDTHTLIKPFKSKEDEEFAIDLLHKTINNKAQFYKIIESRAVNWEMDRIAEMDKIILSMALCELMYIHTPDFVTINEYIEISKLFSTPNSKVYINGILDKFIKKIDPVPVPKPVEVTKITESNLKLKRIVVEKTKKIVVKK